MRLKKEKLRMKKVKNVKLIKFGVNLKLIDELIRMKVKKIEVENLMIDES